MQVRARDLPVYQKKELILNALQSNNVIVVESPTGSGKTTQLPVILYEAGLGKNGFIGVTQPRRIAAISVSNFIADQLEVDMPDIVGYKMRFEDKTSNKTSIKIMTDGILLQEMKLDPLLSDYSVIIVDEAHERSLNIDFILGLLKRILEARSEFKVIISSATINAEIFSTYFGDCPVVKIESRLFPVTVIYDPPIVTGNLIPTRPSETGDFSNDAILNKMEQIITRVVEENRNGDILVFLPGERMIKECIRRINSSKISNYIYSIPLYARLGKNEQQQIFVDPPKGKKKLVVATNIAETSVTIDGITTVLDSGQVKLNFYNPKNFTASLIEVPTSKASCNQRKGRAGRTQPGTCYRLFARSDFENRQLFTMEEIYRTDLSEVVLRMAELGISDFQHFDFISKPPKTGILGAIESLNLLEALDEEFKLTKIGKLMCEFPLLPRHSRMIVEAILNYPTVIEEVLIAAAFLSNQSPFILPPGEELEARKAHHAFRDPNGDFVSYLKIYRAFKAVNAKSKFCEQNYLDERTMNEIDRVKEQIELIVSGLGLNISSGGSKEHYLCAISKGLIQFVCVKQERGMYRSLTASKIQIHPGSVMFRENPQFIVAGEIVRTTRMYAMNVSPLEKHWISKISSVVSNGLVGSFDKRTKDAQKRSGITKIQKRDFTNKIRIGNQLFDIMTEKNQKKQVILDWNKLEKAISELNPFDLPLYHGLKGIVKPGKYVLLEGEKLGSILRILKWLGMDSGYLNDWPRKRNFNINYETSDLVSCLNHVMLISIWKTKTNILGFVRLCTDGNGIYWFQISRSFHIALNESIAALESLIDDLGSTINREEKEKINELYRRLSDFFVT